MPAAPHPDPGGHEEAALRRRLRGHLLALAGLNVAGTVGYMLIEGWNPLDALYMTVITVATIGYGETHPLGPLGRVFTILLIVAGITIVALVARVATEYVALVAQTGYFRRRRMDTRIARLADHYIVCGYGRVGEHVVQDLERQGVPLTIVEHREGVLRRLADAHPVTVGDATDEEVLRRAGIERARGLVACTGEDTANIVITLTARAMQPGLTIVARADDAASEAKLRRAGATHVMYPYRIAGRRIATQLLNPRVTDFLDLVMHSGDLELWLEEVVVGASSRLDGQSLAESGLRDRVGVNVLALCGAGGGAMVTTPPTTHRFAPGETLIVLGTRAQLAALADLARGHGG